MDTTGYFRVLRGLPGRRDITHRRWHNAEDDAGVAAFLRTEPEFAVLSSSAQSITRGRVSLENRLGFELDLVPWGASIQSFSVPTAAGAADVVLGYPDPEAYREDPYFLGATVGRYAGRIRDGAFVLNGHRYQLPTDPDQQGHCLHGGPGGLRDLCWDSSPGASDSVAVFSCRSPDGANGFPGTLDVRVTYELRDNRVLIRLEAESDADTVVNLTNHAYFNLDGSGSVDRHVVRVFADHYLEPGDDLIPTGRLCPVAGTDFDLRNGRRLDETAPYRSGGFDHHFVLAEDVAPSLAVDHLEARLAASVYSTVSRLRLNVYTTQPGLQFYTGQNLRAPFRPRQGLCIEAQACPDSPNQPAFPSTTLSPGERYEHLIVYEVDSEAAAPRRSSP